MQININLFKTMVAETNKIKIMFLCGLCFIALGLMACNAVFPTAISKILQNPRSYEGKEVMVAGRVVDIFSLFVVKCFIIRDGTGDITVVTERSLPRKGDQIKVYGKVEEAFSIGDQQMIVLLENPV